MITPTGALILMVPVLPIAIWVSMNDMARMKIPNKAVLALAAVWPLLGWLAVPTWAAWFWGFGLLGLVLVLGYLLYSTGTFGAGDAKYAAAMAPIFVGTSLLWLGVLVASCLMGALIAHRMMKAIPAVRRATPDWLSWSQPRFFPLGFALSGIIILYLFVAIWPQA